jgi:hypothetical protein
MRYRLLHLPFLAVVILGLTAGLWVALIRIGWSLPGGGALVGLHGPLMIAGVFGTLISLERAVAFAAVRGRRAHPAYAASAVSAIGTVLLLAGGATPAAQVALLVGGVLLLLVNLAMLASHRELHVLVMTVGAAFLVLADAAWLAGAPLALATQWWIAFIVLTIVGERLELARIRVLGPPEILLFAVATGLYVGAALLAAPLPEVGVPLVGVALLALAAWLLRYDVAWITIRRPGLPSFVAVCLLAGYAWLVVAGVIAIAAGPVAFGPVYDAFVHAMLVGFGFSMIFGHAPIVFPAIMGAEIRFHPIAYLPLALLHESVAARVVADLAGNAELRMQAGLVNVLAIVLYAATLIAVNVAGRVRAPRRAPA